MVNQKDFVYNNIDYKLNVKIGDQFCSREEARRQLDVKAKLVGFKFASRSTGANILVYACACYDEYRNTHKLTPSTRTMGAGVRASKKTGCQFYVPVTRGTKETAWSVKRLSIDNHNHPLTENDGFQGVFVTRTGNEVALSKEYLMKFVPKYMAAHIEKVTDVQGDGNCGFRSVALTLGDGQDQWMDVRLKLVEELKAHEVFYLENLCVGQSDLYGDLLNSLSFFKHGKSCTKEHYMIMPDCGLLLANAYKRRVHVFGKEINQSYFPINCLANDKAPIILLFDRAQAHFLNVQLKTGLPPLPPLSEYYSANPQLLNCEYTQSWIQSVENLSWA